MHTDEFLDEDDTENTWLPCPCNGCNVEPWPGVELRDLIPHTAHAEEMSGNMNHGAHFREQPSINRPDCIDVWYQWITSDGRKVDSVYSYGPAFPTVHFHERHPYPTKCGCDSQGRYILYAN